MKTWILAGILFFSSVAFGAEPTTTEGRINRNAYPLARYGEKYTSLPKGVEAELRSRFEEAQTPIRLAPGAWFTASFGHAPTASDRRKIIDSLRETEVWSCKGPGCSGCPGNETSGCVLSNTVSGGVGVVALIHPCLYGEGSCPKGSSSNLAEWIEKVVVGVAYAKQGLPKDGVALRKANKGSSEWLRKTSRILNQMLGACPGPYAGESLKFLFGLEAVTLPNPAVLRCGQVYLQELRGIGKKCDLHMGENREAWRAFEKSMLSPSAEVLRSDAYGMKMLCRAKDAETVFTSFSGKPVLLLGEGACEGETPKKRGNFLRLALPRSLRAAAETKNCLPVTEGSSTVNSDGPGVLLVE